MILFALSCSRGHAFETWFLDGQSYDDQVERGLVSCPTCGETKVAKTIMAPNVVARGTKADTLGVLELDREARYARKAFYARMKEVDVGPRFVEEVRRMHEGEIPYRPVSGDATHEQRQALWEEGIPIVPIAPDDTN